LSTKKHASAIAVSPIAEQDIKEYKSSSFPWIPKVLQPIGDDQTVFSVGKDGQTRQELLFLL
jgi:hypothetical protein